jgi:hypothetical protein
MIARSPRSFLTLLGVMFLAAIFVAPARANIVFTTFTTPSGGGAPIGFAFAGNEFVGTIQKDGTSVLYSVDLNGGNVQTFDPGVSLAGSSSSEHFVASSLGLGGFPSRDIYVAAGSGIVHINNAGTAANIFVSGLNGGVRGILFDAIGTFGGDMLVTTNATSGPNVYRINSAGVVTPLASTGEDTEGLDIAPLGSAGIFSGDLFTASEGSGNIRAITPAGTMTIVANVPSAEELTFVPLDLGATGNPVEGFYGASYPANVQKAGVSQFIGLQGDIIVTGETTHNVTDLHFLGNTSPFYSASLIGTFPNQPEDGIFVTTAIIRASTPVPEPATFTLFGLGLLAAGVVARVPRYRRCKS